MSSQCSSSYPHLESLNIDELMSESANDSNSDAMSQEFDFSFLKEDAVLIEGFALESGGMNPTSGGDLKESCLEPTTKEAFPQENPLVSVEASLHSAFQNLDAVTGFSSKNLAVIARFIATTRTALADLEKNLDCGDQSDPVNRRRAQSQASGCRKRRRLNKTKSSTLVRPVKPAKSARSATKGGKRGQEVSVRAVKVCWKTDEQERDYVWSRGGSWTTELKDQNKEFRRVDGRFLIAQGSDLVVEVRPYGEWLPIKVQLNEEADVFEGWESIDGKRLEIECAVMLEMLTDPESSQSRNGTLSM